MSSKEKCTREKKTLISGSRKDNVKISFEEHQLRREMRVTPRPEGINRERGVLYLKGDFVRVHHGIQNSKLIRHFSNEGKPPSMEQDKSVGKFGEIVSIVDKKNPLHEEIDSVNGYDDFLVAKVKFEVVLHDQMVSNETIKYINLKNFKIIQY